MKSVFLLPFLIPSMAFAQTCDPTIRPCDPFPAPLICEINPDHPDCGGGPAIDEDFFAADKKCKRRERRGKEEYQACMVRLLSK